MMPKSTNYSPAATPLASSNLNPVACGHSSPSRPRLHSRRHRHSSALPPRSHAIHRKLYPPQTRTEDVKYDHPILESILQETYGIIVYQEQIQQAAQQLAGFSLGQGDILRRAMGKKKPEVMAAQREKIYSRLQKKPIKSKPNSPEPSLTILKNLPNTDLINPTLPPTASSPIKPPGSKRTIPANLWPPSFPAK